MGSHIITIVPHDYSPINLYIMVLKLMKILIKSKPYNSLKLNFHAMTLFGNSPRSKGETVINKPTRKLIS